MIITAYQHAGEFLRKVRDVLEQREAFNSLMLGLCLRLERSPEQFKTSPYLAAVEDDRGIVLAGIMTPPYKLVLSTDRNDYLNALELLAQNLMAGGHRVPGATGPDRVAQDFAEVWSKLTGASYRPGLRMRIYELRKVIPPAPVEGRMRWATERDIDQVARWTIAFQQEALNDTMTPESAREFAEARVGEGNIVIWEDGGPVSMAAKARPTANGITVNLVYTPPEFRGRGYATACVATLSQSLLDAGYQFCTLFTDLANPTSNSIYQKIGYQPVGDFNEYMFGDRN